MDTSSASSYSSPHYKLPTTTRPTWPDLNPPPPPPPPDHDVTVTSSVLAKEHMFDKVVTPSDVGKLNRLVIPKQHAEKYFPLDSSNADSKGLLLNFEDRLGKSWRFRYSYWNSSQSYVMTKGWSRFVKDKKLDAGDIVSFHRGGGAEKDRFYIDWRRRPDVPPTYHHQFFHGIRRPVNIVAAPPLSFYNSNNGGYNNNNNNCLYPYHVAPPVARDWGSHSIGGGGGCCSANYNYGVVRPSLCHHGGSVIYLGGSAAVGPQQQIMRGGGGGGGGDHESVVFDSVPVVIDGGKAAGKRLRLFGVNMDCTEEGKEDVHLHDFGLDSDRISSSESGMESGAAAALQLGLRSGCDIADKGKKSSMSLDMDI